MTEEQILKPRKALNPAYLKVKPNRIDIERFKINLITILDQSNDKESEEFHKNLVSDFLKKTWYDPYHYINTKGRNDLVIHNGNKAGTEVGVIIEAKKPTNKAEMPSRSNLNSKAFQELVLYYLRERIIEKNTSVRHLIVTNIYEWFIVDAIHFDRHFAQNKKLVKDFEEFTAGSKADTKTDFFYKSIAEPELEKVKDKIPFTYFDFREYEKPLRNTDKADDAKLIALFKLLSPEHLLKLPFANDSNSLDKKFYSELLHLIGLTETKDGGKKLIGRPKKEDRHPGSLLENAINQLQSLDKLSRLDRPSQYGATEEERLFSVGLELCITWVNRILFLKLLEAQLLSYNKGNKVYNFLSTDKISDFDELNSLFFEVLARKSEDRIPEVKTKFAHVPYLNSSLFEPTEMEHNTLLIANLKNERKLKILPTSVLKDGNGKKLSGELNALEYFFRFLDSYDFSSEGSEEIQEENKTLINASVLGLIFEKINGYKDGSFFTPGFITMYMCRETIRRAVVQKFKEEKAWNIEEFEDLYDKIEDRQEANSLINSLKICDPAVGSGHFLVSALNEIISVKNDLRILQDRNGKRLKEYGVAVVNDELVVTDEDGELYEYNPNNPESQRIQETLFHEKQTIIENCLFGVDINPNSVKICRLRLWIELLKSAYYKTPLSLGRGAGGEGALRELETLPNIDINIKCGNSLVSRFAIDADLSQALKKSKFSIESYRIAVDTYRNAKNKVEKREMERLILEIKQNFSSTITMNNPIKKRLDKLASELYNRFTGTFLFEPDSEYGAKNGNQERKKEQEKLEDEIEKLSKKIDEIKESKIFQGSFEWRFEFPEVLDREGNFVGFDVVIGNPPYVTKLKEEEIKYFQENYKTIQGKKYDLFRFFYEKTIALTKRSGIHSFIVPDVILNLPQASILRSHILNNYSIYRINKIGNNPFEEVQLEPVITFIRNDKKNSEVEYFDLTGNLVVNKVDSKNWMKDNFDFNLNQNKITDNLIEKLKSSKIIIKDVSIWKKGLGVYSRQHLLLKMSKDEVEKIMVERPWTLNYKKDKTFGKELAGKDVGRYEVNWNGVKWLSYGPWLAFQRPIDFFEGPRILVREITTGGKYKVFSSFVVDQYFNNQSIFNGILKPNSSFNLKYILALLNSSLFSYWQIETSPKAFRKLFPTLLMETIENFPLRIIDQVKQDQIIKLVEEVILMKKNKIDSTKIETQIDVFIYELYELTAEEIKIVEGGER